MGVIRKENRAAAAFRRYARLGLDAPMRTDARRERIRGCAADDTDARELFAVAETLHLLDAFGEKNTLATVRALWMEEGKSVPALALDMGCSDRAVFRRLAAVRNCFPHLATATDGWD